MSRIQGRNLSIKNMSFFSFYFLNRNHWDQLNKNESQRHLTHYPAAFVTVEEKCLITPVLPTVSLRKRTSPYLILSPVILDSAYCLIYSRFWINIAWKISLILLLIYLLKFCICNHRQERKSKKQWRGGVRKTPPPPCPTYSRVHACCHFIHVQLFATPWTAACQTPLSMGFSGMNIQSGGHALFQALFLTQGSNPCLLPLLALPGGFLTTSTTWEALQQSSSMFTCFKFLAFKVRFYFSSLPQPPKKFENLWCDLSLRNLSGPKGPVKCWLSLQWRLGKSRIDLDSFSFSAIILKCRSLFKAVIVQISWG